MSYLINDICNFETEFNINIDNNIKYNILSTSFFKMDNHYKNFNIYINGLKNLIQLLNKTENYIMRIFIDENIKNDSTIYSLLKSSPKIQIIIFKCLDYQNKSFHIDVFGALIRLFPIFDFDNNDANDVIIIDIDANKDDSQKLLSLIKYRNDKNNQNKIEIIGMGNISDLLIKNKLPHFYCTVCGFFNKKYDKNIILDFIKNAKNIMDKGYYNKRETPFGYGTDELFLNDYFIYANNFKNIKDVKLNMFIPYNLNWFLYYFKNDLVHHQRKLSFTYMKFLLGKYWNNNSTFDEMFNLLDKYTYNPNNYSDEKKYLGTRYYKLMKYLRINNKEWFDPFLINIISKYFNKILFSISIIEFNPMNLQIIKINHLHKNLI